MRVRASPVGAAKSPEVHDYKYECKVVKLRQGRVCVCVCVVLHLNLFNTLGWYTCGGAGGGVARPPGRYIDMHTTVSMEFLRTQSRLEPAIRRTPAKNAQAGPADSWHSS